VQEKATLLPGGVLPVAMSLPDDQPPSTNSGLSDYILWRLTVKAPYPIVGFLEKYTIPVRSATDGTGGRTTAEDEDAGDFSRSSLYTPKPAAQPTGDQAVFLFLFALVPLVLGGYLLVRGARDIGEAMASTSWPTAQGTIVESRVVATGKRGGGTFNYYPKVIYTYTVNGKEYTGDEVYPHLFWSQGPSLRVVEAYPFGSMKTVHYSPNQPEEAMLEPGLRLGVFQQSVLATLVLSMAILFGINSCTAVPVLRAVVPVSKIAGTCVLLILAQGLYLFFTS